ncbi:PREDICTED: histidine kinase 5 [Tarenaya hassleriana]|uniref:histidine kinase 5 n=1 Tax=Tarenaya hassleriana TaxID=28532 RepID=UPI00053C6170|nr:PREDICTED: histidine kinase 5 [Tarenaya hassleriana]
MVCEMETEQIEDMEIEVLSSMWPEDVGTETDKQFNVEKPAGDQDMLKEVTIEEKQTFADLRRLSELMDSTDQGSSQLTNLVKQWEYMQANAVRLLREELKNLSRQREEAEAKELKIIEEHKFESDGRNANFPVLDETCDLFRSFEERKRDKVVERKKIDIDEEYDTVAYWKQRALNLEKMLEESTEREWKLLEKLNESLTTMESHSAPVEELTQNLKRAEGFLHFILQNAPVVMGHQDNDLRYLFIYNKFPSLREQDILGKTDVEIFSGAGVKESQDFKREVLEKGKPSKREITFETELFGSKTFLIYVEPVYNKAGEKLGINYMGMEVTDQVRKREKMVKLREDKAVRNAMESELNKTIHITEETMRAKQMLATMSHEIRSPLSGVVSMAEILSTTKLDHEQRQLLNVMISSGDLVLQLINDILDLSKVESGVMKLEATQFRPREVVKHVLQTAAASLKKALTLEGHIQDNVPIEVVGDVLRIRQILTNLISNAIKFTHRGKVGIKLEVIQEPSFFSEDRKEPRNPTPIGHNENTEDAEEYVSGTAVWIRCDVYDTGIGIPEKAIPTLFKKYMQASADHARKYGGTGLGLAICKQLVELMGGRLTVTSHVNVGSTFTFILPYKVAQPNDHSDDPDEFSDMADHQPIPDDTAKGFFQFKQLMGSLYSSDGPVIDQNFLVPHKIMQGSPVKVNGFASDPSHGIPLSDNRPNERAAVQNGGYKAEGAETSPRTDTSCGPCPDSAHQFPNGRIKTSKEDTLRCPSESKEFESCSSTQTSNEGGTVVMETKPSVSSQRQETKPEADSKETSKPKILLVEDNRINVMVTTSMMKQLGHTIEVVNNGIEAIRAVQTSSYDLVLMDVCMPVLDGLKATRLIRSFEENGNWEAAKEAGIDPNALSPDNLQNGQVHLGSAKRLPIIAMTANTLSESAEECYAHGMDSFISKPVTFQKLKECLEQYVA